MRLALKNKRQHLYDFLLLVNFSFYSLWKYIFVFLFIPFPLPQTSPEVQIDIEILTTLYTNIEVLNPILTINTHHFDDVVAGEVRY